MYSFRPIALCCGLESKDPYENHWRNRNMIGEGSSLTLAYPQHRQQQPYMLLTHPVILQTTASSPNINQKHQQQFFAAQSLQPGHQAQLGYVASPYATIYNAQNRYDHLMSASGFFNSPLRRIENPYFISGGGAAVATTTTAATNFATSNNMRLINQVESQYQLQQQQHPSDSQHQQQQHHHHHHQGRVDPNSIVLRNDVRKIGTLSSEVFRQLEAVEKQAYDMNIDMEAVEKRGEVITRELEASDLSRCVNEDTIRRYHDQKLIDPECYSIRFVEIIKRPGQTLGLYIRTVTFDDAPGRLPPRDGVIITKIGYDSPIFNGSALNVGDEILSVNFVDIQGMSLDDVVIIMSIPKRLILALRSPKHPHLAAPNQLVPRPIQQPGAMPIAMPMPMPMTMTPMTPSRGGIRHPSMQQQQHSQQSMNANSIILEEHEQSSAFNGLDNMDNSQHPMRVQAQQQHQLANDCQMQQSQNRNSDFESGQRFARDSFIINQANSNNSNNIISNSSNQPSSAANHLANLSNHQLHHSPSVVADYRPYDLSQFRPVSQMSLHRASYASAVSTSPYRTTSNVTLGRGGSVAIGSTTIGQHPDSSSEQTTATPTTTTSYFSSSIDAINRELKDLRRQRMALDSLNNNISSLDFNDSSIDDDRPIILPSQINLYSSLPSTMTRAPRIQSNPQSIGGGGGGAAAGRTSSSPLTAMSSMPGISSSVESEPNIGPCRDQHPLVGGGGSLGRFADQPATPNKSATPRTPRILPSPPNTSNMSDIRSQSAFPDYGQLSCT